MNKNLENEVANCDMKNAGRVAGLLAGTCAGIRAGENIPFDLPGGYTSEKEFVCVGILGLIGGLSGFALGDKVGEMLDNI